MAKTAKTAREAALGMLARREHAVEELLRKLVDKGFHGREAREVVTALIAEKLVDDARYAGARARYRAVISRWGATRIKQELRQAGVDEETVIQAMAGLAEEGVVLEEMAAKAMKRRFGGKPLPRAAVADPALGGHEARLLRQKEKARRVAYLVRRGFSTTEAIKAVDEGVEE